jgi:hypothetical protein
MKILPCTAGLVAAFAVAGCGQASAGHEATTSAGAARARLHGLAPGHPRLLVTAADVKRLRGWATRSNPFWSQGLAVLARNAKKDMTRGLVPRKDGGSDSYEEYPTEWYAELFAFMSMVDPHPAERADYGSRARRLLMYVIGRSAPGRGSDNQPFRDPDFSTSDRSRWQGEAYGLTVDWAYSYFSRADRAKIRKVFLRWAAEQYRAYPLDAFDGPHPSPSGAADNPALLQNPAAVRWSLNNYYVAHARNLGLMALALDPRDDPGGRLRHYLASVTGNWLYVIDHALRSDAAGGFSPEGFEYGPDSLGRLLQLLYALHTAGRDNPASPGPQVSIAANPFWGDFVSDLLESLPPSPTRLSGDDAYLGQIWQPAWFGSAENYRAPDFITALAPLALSAAARGDQRTLDTIRWIETNIPPGGRSSLLARAGGDTDQFLDAILYFLLFDPHAAPPADPRPQLPLQAFAPGINRILARTCWCADGRMFNYGLSWTEIDHQFGDGNDFGFWRKGEWLTKQRSGYHSGGSFTDYQDSVTIENDPPQDNDPSDNPHGIWQRGDQWVMEPAGDPKLVAHSSGDGYVYALGDATNLYNSPYQHSTDVTEASRSIVWLEPDLIVVYDRAATGKPDRFKRFWLQLPAPPQIAGNRATVQTPGGQQLFSTTLLPAGASLTSVPDDDSEEPATDEPMRYRLMVTDPTEPQAVRFLNVIQGADGGAAPAPALLVRSAAGTPYEGAAVGGTLALFPLYYKARFGSLTIDVPAGVSRVLVTGLAASGRYQVDRQSGGAGVRLSVAPGGDNSADAGGVLSIAL